MFPGIDGFHWTAGHIIFLSLFFAVVMTILGLSRHPLSHRFDCPAAWARILKILGLSRGDAHEKQTIFADSFSRY